MKRQERFLKKIYELCFIRCKCCVGMCYILKVGALFLHRYAMSDCGVGCSPSWQARLAGHQLGPPPGVASLC